MAIIPIAGIPGSITPENHRTGVFLSYSLSIKPVRRQDNPYAIQSGKRFMLWNPVSIYCPEEGDNEEDDW
jgi:hypothetical protein